MINQKSSKTFKSNFDIGSFKFKHGMCGTKIYSIWLGMKKRCLYPKHKQYPRYGGRGIKIDNRWMSFENFFKDMGFPPEGYQLDRKNNNGDYCPENCRWVTPKENSNNKPKKIKWKKLDVAKFAIADMDI